MKINSIVYNLWYYYGIKIEPVSLHNARFIMYISTN